MRRGVGSGFQYALAGEQEVQASVFPVLPAFLTHLN